MLFLAKTMARRLIPLLVLVLLAAAPAAAQAYLPPGFVGVSPQNSGTAEDYELMREAGIKSVRQPMVWRAVEPQNPAFSERQWGYIDHEVRLAAKNQMEVFPFLIGSPEWVASEEIDLPVANAWQRRAWASFVRAVVARYGVEGSFWREEEDIPYIPMRRFEIWNEENIVSFANDPEPARFAKLIRIAGRVIHRRQPGAKVIVGGLFGRPLQIPPNVASGDFLARMYRAKRVKPYFDGIALHPYVADARAMIGQLRNLRRIARKYGDAKVPLYITELGWGSSDGPTRWQRGLYGQARELDAPGIGRAGISAASGGSPGPTSAGPASSATPPGCSTAGGRPSRPGTGSTAGPAATPTWSRRLVAATWIRAKKRR